MSSRDGAAPDPALNVPDWWVGWQYLLPDGTIATRFVFKDGRRATVNTRTIPDDTRLAELAAYLTSPPPPPKQSRLSS